MYIIDRIEDGYAVIESDLGRITLPKKLLPMGAAEGDVLKKSGDGYIISREETEARRKLALDLTKKVFGE